MCLLCQVVHKSDGTPVEPANPRVRWPKGADLYEDLWRRPGLGTWGESLDYVVFCFITGSTQLFIKVSTKTFATAVHFWQALQ